MRTKFIKESDVRNLVILFVLTILMIVLYGQIDYMREPFANWDLSVYIRMALFSPEINPDIIQPFAYRILGPYIVGLVPIPNILAFYIFSVFFSICLVFQFYYLLRYIGLPANISAITVVLFIFNKWLFGFTLWNYFQLNDLLSLNFIIIMFLSMWRNQWIVFGFILLLGAITREVSMLMIPVVFAYLLEKKELSDHWPKVVASIIPGLLAFVLIRVIIPTCGGNSLIDALIIYSPYTSILRLLGNSFIPLSFIPLIFFKNTIQFFKTKKYLLLYFTLVLFSTMFGGNNERLMAPSFIIFYSLIGTIMHKLNPKKTFLLIIMVVGFLSSFHHEFAKWPLPNVKWTYLFTFGTTLIITSLMFLLNLQCYMQKNE